MVNERVLKIAETGQIPANDPVSNIMSQVEIKQDDEPGLWGSFKKWAGSKGGRMTLGGLGTALSVGLSGGDFRDALGYGVIGAGNTAKTLYRNEQDAKHWADRAAQRNLYWQNYEADRKLRQMLQDERIKAQKDLATENYRQSMDALAQQYTLNQMALDAAETRAESRQNKLLDDLGVAPALRPHLTALMNGINLGGAMENYNRNILLDPNSSPEARAAAQQYFEAQKQFDAMMRPPLTLAESAGIAKDAGLTLDSGALNEGRAVFADKPTALPDDVRRFEYWTSRGYKPDEARQLAKITLPSEETDEELRFEQGKSNIADNSYYNRGNFDFGNEQRAADAQLGRDKEMANEMYGGNYFQNKPANSSFNTEQQKQLAKDTDEYRNMVSKLPELKKTVEKLRKLAEKATYTYFGRGLDWASQQLLGDTTEGAIAREEYMAIVNNQILPLLRDTFGAQFTEREGEQLRQTLGNVNATPEQKIAILNSFIAQKEADIASKQRKIASYDDNDPLGIL